MPHSVVKVLWKCFILKVEAKRETLFQKHEIKIEVKRMLRSNKRLQYTIF